MGGLVDWWVAGWSGVLCGWVGWGAAEVIDEYTADKGVSTPPTRAWPNAHYHLSVVAWGGALGQTLINYHLSVVGSSMPNAHCHLSVVGSSRPHAHCHLSVVGSSRPNAHCHAARLGDHGVSEGTAPGDGSEALVLQHGVWCGWVGGQVGSSMPKTPISIFGGRKLDATRS